MFVGSEPALYSQNIKGSELNVNIETWDRQPLSTRKYEQSFPNIHRLR